MSSRWLLPVVISVISLAVAGGLLARDLYERRDAPAQNSVSLPESRALPPEDQPGSAEVKLSPDAAAHPHGQTVRGLLQAYIDGINERNYEKWKTSVTEARVRDKPEEAWQEAYRTTKNGSVLVQRIETAPADKLRILVSFTSTQDSADAPPRLPATCIRWKLVFPLAVELGHWRIDALPPGSPAVMARC